MQTVGCRASGESSLSINVQCSVSEERDQAAFYFGVPVLVAGWSDSIFAEPKLVALTELDPRLLTTNLKASSVAERATVHIPFTEVSQPATRPAPELRGT